MEWIDVKQKLPDYGVPVWVVWDGVVQHIAYERHLYGWYPASGDGDSAPKNLFSHWMPLPAPPTK